MNVFSRLKESYVRFVEKQGFPIIVTACVAVITATALWTGRQEDAWISPTPPPSGDVSASRLMQQSLHQAATATPAPTDTPRQWSPPLEAPEILREFSSDSMVQSGVTGVWAVHDSVDLASPRGSKVFAMSEGNVTGHGQDDLLGAWVRIDHGDGMEALYAGMAMVGSFLTGDAVRADDVIGYAGIGPLDEHDLPPHLHLRVTQNGRAIDPSCLWTAAQ